MRALKFLARFAHCNALHLWCASKSIDICARAELRQDIAMHVIEPSDAERSLGL